MGCKPHKGESQDDFISRFMSEMKDEFPDQDQRLAVAYAQLRKRGYDVSAHPEHVMTLARRGGGRGVWMVIRGPWARQVDMENGTMGIVQPRIMLEERYKWTPVYPSIAQWRELFSLGADWDEDLHPRDANGRFTDSATQAMTGGPADKTASDYWARVRAGGAPDRNPHADDTARYRDRVRSAEIRRTQGEMAAAAASRADSTRGAATARPDEIAAARDRKIWHITKKEQSRLAAIDREIKESVAHPAPPLPAPEPPPLVPLTGKEKQAWADAIEAYRAERAAERRARMAQRKATK